MEPVMELSSRERSRRSLIGTLKLDRGQSRRSMAGGHRAIVEAHAFLDTRLQSRLLAPLAVGDRLPWKLDREGEPQWVVVVDVLRSTSYLVRYANGSTETLVDSE
jgi:hypothetical protein